MKLFRLFIPMLALVLIGQGCVEVYNPSEEAIEGEQEMLAEEVQEETGDDVEEAQEESAEDVEATDEEQEKTGQVRLEASLTDLTGGNATGNVVVTYDSGAYALTATFSGLMDPEDGYFYEGWVVRKGGDLSVISTGALEKVDGVYTNAFESDKDLTDHVNYVLTIEPDDGDPLPAGHVLDGTLE